MNDKPFGWNLVGWFTKRFKWTVYDNLGNVKDEGIGTREYKDGTLYESYGKEINFGTRDRLHIEDIPDE